MGSRSRLRGKEKRETLTLRWTAAGVIVAILAIAIAVAIAMLSRGNGSIKASSDEPAGRSAAANMQTCLDRASASQFSDLAINTWYCETEFATLWRHGKPAMFTRNKSVLGKYFSYLDPREDRQGLSFTEDTLTDTVGLAGGAKLSRLFHDFPTYEGRFSLVGGQVRDLRKLSSAEGGWTD